MTSQQDELREASARFYAGLNRMANGDASALADIWSHGPEALSMHPIGGREEGWGQVQEAFQKVAQLASGGKIRLEEQIVRVAGDFAYEVGVERGSVTLAGETAAIDQRVTNIYRREAGTWKIVHHHTDIAPAMLEILTQLRSH
jgi:ketosteroid isomerase-like protein